MLVKMPRDAWPNLDRRTRPPAGLEVLLKMMGVQCAPVGRSDNGAARRLERSMSSSQPRHRVNGEALVGKLSLTRLHGEKASHANRDSLAKV